MTAQALIASLAADVRPVPRQALVRRLVIGLIGGGAATLALTAVFLGFRPDLGSAISSFSFWMKLAYTVSLGVAGTAIAARFARPERGRLRAFWLALIPLAALAFVAFSEMARAPAEAWPAMWLGQTWKKCPFVLLGLATPIFVGLLWSFRRFAPTRLQAAGASAGLAAGAWAAVIYCLHCPEVSALFVATWYSLGVLLATGFGALLGGRLLKW